MFDDCSHRIELVVLFVCTFLAFTTEDYKYHWLTAAAITLVCLIVVAGIVVAVIVVAGSVLGILVPTSFIVVNKVVLGVSGGGLT